MRRHPRWHFEQKGRYWIWRELGADGKIIASSSLQRDYGQAVSDAIDHGFRPQEQRWEIISHGQVTGYKPPRKSGSKIRLR